jgi:adenosylmethionine-8-amino-7-oxononanoate aminotransferase
MHKAPIAALAMALSLVGIAAHAQAPPATTPQQDLAPANPKLNLTLEQRHTIREIIKDKKADAAPAEVAAAVGEPVPQGVAPRPMPSDVARKVPQVRAHNYFLTAQQIVIVDPKDNRVAEVIERSED